MKVLEEISHVESPSLSEIEKKSESEEFGFKEKAQESFCKRFGIVCLVFASFFFVFLIAKAQKMKVRNNKQLFWETPNTKFVVLEPKSALFRNAKQNNEIQENYSTDFSIIQNKLTPLKFVPVPHSVKTLLFTRKKPYLETEIRESEIKTEKKRDRGFSFNFSAKQNSRNILQKNRTPYFTNSQKFSSKNPRALNLIEEIQKSKHRNPENQTFNQKLKSIV